MEKAFTCKHKRELTEYVGSKLTFNHDAEGKDTIRFTQPVLIQKLSDKYKVPNGPASKMPVVA